MDSIQGTRTTAPTQAAGKAPARATSKLNDFVQNRAEQVLGKPAADFLKAWQAPAAKPAEALASKDFAGLERSFRMMDKGERLQALSDMRAKDPENYKALLGAIRSGDIKDSSVTLPAGIDRLRSTKWAQEGEGKEVTQHVINQYNAPAKDPWAADSRIAVGNTDGHVAKTQADEPGPEAGRGGKGAKSSINLSPDVAGSPEVLAALLAHEGQHSMRTSQGKLKNELFEETDAHHNQSAVWNEFSEEERGQAKNPGTNRVAMTFDIDAAHYQADSKRPMMGYVAREYTDGYIKRYQEKKENVDLHAANQILADYAHANEKSGNNRVFNAASEDVKSGIWNNVLYMTNFVSSDEDKAKYRKPFVMLN